MSGWWSLLLFVPIINILIHARCLAFPEGYVDHKRLDVAARVILGLMLGASVVAVGLLLVIGAHSPFR
jgi:hypothetical protein